MPIGDWLAHADAKIGFLTPFPSLHYIFGRVVVVVVVVVILIISDLNCVIDVMTFDLTILTQKEK